MLNSVGERTPPYETPVDVVWMCDFYMLFRLSVP